MKKIILFLLLVLYACSHSQPTTVYEKGDGDITSRGSVYKNNPKQQTVTVYSANTGKTQAQRPVSKPVVQQPQSPIYKQPQITAPVYQAPKPVSKPQESYSSVGYTIQAGAFSNPDYAALLSDSLEGKGLDPFYFKDASGLYKVRFGSFRTKEAAIAEAKRLQKNKIITEYYIVNPADYTISKNAPKGTSKSNYIRDELVKSAQRYIGVPYKWGGNTKAGIDCSGLTQAVYNLNGLKIPRNSREQHKRGRTITQKQLQKGDLVFFATNGGRTVSHVGVYIGDGKFIHAPSKGKKVTTARLADPYFKKTYVGAKSYL